MKRMPFLLSCAAALLLPSCIAWQQGVPCPEGRPLVTTAEWSSEHVPVVRGYSVEEELIPLTPELEKALSLAAYRLGLMGYAYMTRCGERMVFTDNLKKVPTDGGRMVGFVWEGRFHFRQLRRYRVTEEGSGKPVCSFSAALVAYGVPGHPQETYGELLWSLENPAGAELLHEAYFCTPAAAQELTMPQGTTRELMKLPQD